MSTGLPVAFILFRNIETFLPDSAPSNDITDSRGVSVVMSSQVGERSGQSQLLTETPLSLNFTFQCVGSDSQACRTTHVHTIQDQI